MRPSKAPDPNSIVYPIVVLAKNSSNYYHIPRIKMSYWVSLITEPNINNRKAANEIAQATAYRHSLYRIECGPLVWQCDSAGKTT